MRTENATAAPPTAPSIVISPAADEASALTATRFAAPAHQYQTVSVHAEATQHRFATPRGAGAVTYAIAKVANAIAAK